ncbi:MAG: hypothetical protein QXO69_02945 [archaeon]
MKKKDKMSDLNVIALVLALAVICLAACFLTFYLLFVKPEIDTINELKGKSFSEQLAVCSQKTGKLQSTCITYVAIKNANQSSVINGEVCNLIKNDNDRIGCFYLLVAKTKNTSLCGKIMNENEKEVCYSWEQLVASKE